MRPELLRQWLWPMRDYFEHRGLALQAGGGPSPEECERLARILMEPAPDAPPDLLEALCVFREMDNAPAEDALRAEAVRQHLDLGLADPATPLDVVMRAWALDRQMVERLHQRLELSRPRAFHYFSTVVEPVPPFDGPGAHKLAELERRLNLFYEAWNRGKGARVFAYQQPEEWVFLVRHGAPWRREGVMENDEPATLVFRPRKHDVLKYAPAHGEMAINCCGQRERRVLLRVFGLVLFGRPDFFPGTARYTLAPLVRHGRSCLILRRCARHRAGQSDRSRVARRRRADAPRHPQGGRHLQTGRERRAGVAQERRRDQAGDLSSEVSGARLDPAV